MKRLLSIGLGCLALANPLWAVGSGGFTNQVVGSKALGMGNAFVATADDPSAVFFNPAGLTQMPGATISVGFAPHFPSTDYKADNGTTDSMESKTPIVPNFYGSVPFADRKFVLALGIQFPFGLSTKWSDTGPLRYVATESKLTVFQLNPTVAYRFNDQLSFGAGVVYGRTSADLKSRMNLSALNTFLTSFPTASPDGNKQLNGTSYGWGYNLGVLFNPTGNHAIGVSYRSIIMNRIKGKTELSNLSGAAAAVFGGDKYSVDTETDLNLPQSLVFGYAFKPGKWTFEADAEWVDYSSIGESYFDFKGESNATRLAVLNTGNPVKRMWHSSWNFGFGGNYKFNDTWQTRAGYFYYPEVVPEVTWDPSNPESARQGFTFGESYALSSWLSLDLAYNFILFQKRTIHNNVGASSASTVNGEYKTNAHILSLNLTYRFGSI